MTARFTTFGDLERLLTDFGIDVLSIKVPHRGRGTWQADVRRVDRGWTIGKPCDDIESAIEAALNRSKDWVAPPKARSSDLEDLLG